MKSYLALVSAFNISNSIGCNIASSIGCIGKVLLSLRHGAWGSWWGGSWASHELGSWEAHSNNHELEVWLS